MMKDPKSEQGRSTRIGELLVSLGYLRPDQLAKVLQVQKERPPEQRVPIGTLCVEMGIFSRERLDLILDRFGKRLRLGELLVHRNQITPLHLDQALERQRQQGGRLGEILLEMELIDERILAETLADQHDLAYVPLAGLEPQPELTRYLNAHYSMRHGVVPIGKLGHRLTVAISDPTSRETRGDLERSTGLKVHIVLSTPSEVATFARQLYEFKRAPAVKTEMTGVAVRENETSNPFALFLGKLITRAAALQASDLHLEPGDGGGRVRIRVDGALQDLTESGQVEGKIPGLVRAIKMMAHLDLGDVRRPQEGSIAFHTNEGDFSRALSLHVSTIPGPAGEEAAIRLLDPTRAGISLADAGLSESIRARFEKILRQTKGVVLIAGPPGSGKRSTLRASLSVLRREDAKILTAEDPIIFIHPGISQAQVDPSIGNTYVSYLRRFRRQDPDAILLDEIPDRETAELAFGTGGAGPLIVATVRANNATDAAMRLMDIGVDPNMMGSSLAAVLAQRLIRRNCPSCCESYEPRSTILDQWFRGIPSIGSRAVRGRGCERCNGAGFAGRVAAAELWVPSPEEDVWISERIEARLLRERVLRRMRCLGQDALEQAIAGRTTFEEALKVVPHEDVVFTRMHGLERDKERLQSESVPSRDAA